MLACAAKNLCCRLIPLLHGHPLSTGGSKDYRAVNDYPLLPAFSACHHLSGGCSRDRRGNGALCMHFLYRSDEHAGGGGSVLRWGLKDYSI